MPPKKAPAKIDKTKQKSVEDKTFGLKNKNKSAKVARFVQQVQQQASQSGRQNQKAGPSKKELEAQKKAELSEIFKPVHVQQKVPFGVDPKTIVCQFYKAGTCTKGKTCKFSHDLDAGRKGAKIDLYTDARDDEKQNDTMDKWDQAKLEQVVQTKHGKGVQPTTEIVCKFFIQAVEDSKYGWFWQCPNGDSCKYRHALPPGFVLKEKNKKKTDEPVQTLEEWIDEQKSNMPDKLTPVTLESFNKWKKERKEKEQKEEEDKTRKREAAVRAGKSIGASGRELFQYNPELFAVGDDEEAWEGDYTQREYDEEEEEEQSANEPHSEKRKATAIDESLFEGEDLDALSLVDDDEE